MNFVNFQVIKGYGEMVDTQDLGPCGKNIAVRVQVPLSEFQIRLF